LLLFRHSSQASFWLARAGTRTGAQPKSLVDDARNDSDDAKPYRDF